MLRIETSERQARSPLSQTSIKLRDLRELKPQVLSKIHEKYFIDLYRYARYRVSDSNLAEDIASETFIRLLDAIHARKGPNQSLRGWLYGTASNLINDHFRRMYREDELLAEGKLDHEAERTGNVIKKVEQQDLLSTAIESLTEEQQHVIALRFGNGMSIEETARILEKSVNAVKAMQFRAIRSLRRQLEVDE
jgi:RNA polymerase sigma-70 factor (ECF subfamily)